jgi:hypothetical protein
MHREQRLSFDAMIKSCLFAAVVLAASPVWAQTQKVTIDQMSVKPATRTIELMLTARPNPTLTAALQGTPFARGWLVQSLETATGAMRNLEVENVTVDSALPVLTLKLASVDPPWLDTATHTVSVTFLRSSNLARAVSTPTAAQPSAVSQGGFGAAPTAQAADVYFSGKITAAGGAQPKYSFEAKLQNDWELAGNRGHLGYLAEVAADESTTNVDPDRINAGVKYRTVLDPRPRGLILQVQPIAVEFTRKSPRTTTILATGHVEHVLVPTTGSAAARWAMVVLSGVEIGNNSSNAINKDDGSGLVARLRVAANPYVVLKPANGPFKSLKGSAFWDARFLANEEIDPGRLDDHQLPTLTRRPRQYLKVDIDLGLNDLISLTLQHRWGYLPPAYKKVNPTLTLSLTFKGQWL